LGAANQEMMFHLAPKLLAATSEQANQLARRGRVRRNVNMLGSMAIGLSTGGLSAIFNKVVFVLFGTVVIALASITPYLLLPMMLSRARKRGAG